MGTQHMFLLSVLIMSNPFSSFVCGEDKHVSLELWGPSPFFFPSAPHFGETELIIGSGSRASVVTFAFAFWVCHGKAFKVFLYISLALLLV